LFRSMMKALKVPRGRRGIFINMVVNDNCLFIGLPVQIALFGQEALPYFLLYYIGNTISVWMVGVFLIELDPLPNSEVDFNNGSHKIDSIHNSSVSTEGKSKKPKFDWKKLLPP
ncbi:Auxin Efflux Carrier, partial [human gut metagenome]